MKETPQFHSSLILLIVLNAIVKPAWIIRFGRQVQNETGVKPHGTYFYIFNLSIVAGFLHDRGLTTFCNRQLAVRDENLTGNAGNLIFLDLLFALIYITPVSVVINAVISFLLIPPLGAKRLLPGSNYEPVFLWFNNNGLYPAKITCSCCHPLRLNLYFYRRTCMRIFAR
jgi:hypothetical protein